jgi:hypothetical protein
MFWKRLSSDATLIDGPLRIPPPLAHSRFEEAWKEFDKLDAAVHGRGPMKWLRSGFDVTLGIGGVLGLKFWHQHRDIVTLAWSAYIGLALAYTQIMKARFVHWQCPRCRAEWPGTKKDKDSRCRTCGLRLHELA